MTTDYAGGGIGLGPRVEHAPAEPYPAPEVTSRDGVPGPDKPAVRSLAAYATSHGWAVAEPTYARGRFPNAATARSGSVQDSLALRMARGTERAAAVYVGGSTWTWKTLIIRRIENDLCRFHRFDTLEAFKAGLL